MAAWNAKVATIPGAVSTFTNYFSYPGVGDGVFHNPDSGFGYLQVPLPLTHNKWVLKLEAIIDKYPNFPHEGTVYVYIRRGGFTMPIGQCTTFGVKTFEGFYQHGDILEIREDSTEVVSVNLVITIKHLPDLATE